MLKTIHTASRPAIDTPRTPLIAGLFHRLVEADRRYRERRALSRLSQDQLKDAGLTRDDVNAL